MSTHKRARKYQKDIIERILSANKNSLVVLPTGGGKTFIASEMGKKAGRVLFLAPKVNLLEQTMESFAHLQPQKIHASSEYDEKKKIFVSTLQTISRNPHIIEELEIDMVIIDEVHFGHSGKMQEVIRNAHKGIFVGLSATPYDIEGRLLEGYGNVIDKYDIEYMVKKKYLTPVEIISPLSIDLSDIKIQAGDYNEKQLDAKMSNVKMITAVIENSYKHLIDKKKTLVFAVSILHAEKLATMYKKVFKRDNIKKKIAVLHSGIDKKKRERVLNNFKHRDIDILVSVNMITEGMDAPQVDSEVIARPTKSQNLYKQIIGRGMRLHPSKKSCFIIDCGNVVENLGMPMSPIVEREKIEKEKKARERKRCSSCNKPRKRILISENGIFYKVCSYCGNEKEEFSDTTVHKCSSCGYAHTLKTHEKNYRFTEFGIGLACSKCKNVTELSFFKNEDYFEDELKNAVTTYILSKINILSEECFLKAVENSIDKKRQIFLRIIFGAREITPQYLKEMLETHSKAINNKCLQSVPVEEGRKYFVKELKSKYVNIDAYRESILMELKYYEKYKKYLTGNGYIHATSWYMESFESVLKDSNSRLQLF